MANFDANTSGTTRYIWEYLIKEYENPYGVAALMGNLYAESSLNRKCCTGGKVKTAVDGTIYCYDLEHNQKSENDFAHDGVAFGLAQWCYWSRKQALFQHAQTMQQPVTSLDVQLDFLIKEMKSYKTVLINIQEGSSIKVISDVIMERYEKPANMSDSVKEKRAAYGQQFYDMFTKESDKPSVVFDQNGDLQSNKKYVRTTANKVLIRTGPGKDYDIIASIMDKGTSYKWIATAENGWNAIEYATETIKKRAGWISPDYSEIITGSG